MIARINDATWRKNATVIVLDEAEAIGDFATPLERQLGLPTDAEEREYQAWWTVGRNKAYVWFTFLAVIISIIALWIALAK